MGRLLDRVNDDNELSAGGQRVPLQIQRRNTLNWRIIPWHFKPFFLNSSLSFELAGKTFRCKGPSLCSLGLEDMG